MPLRSEVLPSFAYLPPAGDISFEIQPEAHTGCTALSRNEVCPFTAQGIAAGCVWLGHASAAAQGISSWRRSWLSALIPCWTLAEALLAGPRIGSGGVQAKAHLHHSPCLGGASIAASPA